MHILYTSVHRAAAVEPTAWRSRQEVMSQWDRRPRPLPLCKQWKHRHSWALQFSNGREKKPKKLPKNKISAILEADKRHIKQRRLFHLQLLRKKQNNEKTHTEWTFLVNSNHFHGPSAASDCFFLLHLVINTFLCTCLQFPTLVLGLPCQTAHRYVFNSWTRKNLLS